MRERLLVSVFTILIGCLGNVIVMRDPLLAASENSKQYDPTISASGELIAKIVVAVILDQRLEMLTSLKNLLEENNFRQARSSVYAYTSDGSAITVWFIRPSGPNIYVLTLGKGDKIEVFIYKLRDNLTPLDTEMILEKVMSNLAGYGPALFRYEKP